MKKLLTICLLALMLFVSPWPIAGQGGEKGVDEGPITPQGSEQKMDAQSFFDNFVDALKANDQARIKELVRQAGPHIVYTVTMQVATEGIQKTAEGKDGSIYFNTAEAMAAAYATVFKQEGLIELVRKYEGFTLEMCREQLKGGDLLDGGISFYNKGQWKEALDKWNESLEIFKKIADVKGEATVLGGIGAVYYRLDQYATALEYHQGSLEIMRRIGDWAGEARALGNIGIVYESLGQYAKALEYYQKSLDIARKISNGKIEAGALDNIGIIYDRLGQYAKALEYHQGSLEIARRIGDQAGEAGALTNIGNVYDCLGQYTKGLEYHQKSLDIARKISNGKIEASALGNIGNVYKSLGQYAKALEYYEGGLEIMRRIGDQAGEAGALDNIGNVYGRLGQYAKALEYHQGSLEIMRRIGDQAGEARALANIGSAYHDLGQYKNAIQPLRESIKISEGLGELETVWRGYTGLGEALWKSGKGEEAVAHYQQAVDMIEALYQHTTGFKEEERSSMIGEKHFVYKEFIDLLLELHRDHPNKGYDQQAFTIAEKAKSRTFQELMAKAGAKIAFAEEATDEIFKKMIEQEQQLIIVITNRRTLLTTELSKPEQQRNQEIIDSLKDQLAKAEKSLSEHKKKIDAKYPRYADLRRPKSLTVEELQGILKPDEILLAYAVGKDKIAAFVISQGRFKMIGLAVGTDELAKLVKGFRKGLDDVHEETWDKDLEQFKPAIAYSLNTKIFEPVSSELKDVKTLYITADDILYTLPFEALVDQAIDQTAFEKAKKEQKAYFGEFSTLHYLIDNPYTITYLPSASVLRSLRKYEKKGYGSWQKSLIAYADPIFGPEEGKTGKKEGEEKRGISKETELTVQILMQSTGAGKLKRLEESAKEAEAIAKEVKGKEEDIYLRDKATEENVYKTRLKDARYLLFSTHGLLGGDFFGVAEPALVLTLINNPPERDGFLTMSKILGLDLNAELIILSACKTAGQGDKAGQGEGFAGLTRSFMYAGTKSILVTHWSVDSQAARVLMVNMFKNMKEESRAKALRDVKLTMKGSTMDLEGLTISLSHPFFWAPFVLVGEDE